VDIVDIINENIFFGLIEYWFFTALFLGILVYNIIRIIRTIRKGNAFIKFPKIVIKFFLCCFLIVFLVIFGADAIRFTKMRKSFNEDIANKSISIEKQNVWNSKLTDKENIYIKVDEENYYLIESIIELNYSELEWGEEYLITYYPRSKIIISIEKAERE